MKSKIAFLLLISMLLPLVCVGGFSASAIEENQTVQETESTVEMQPQPDALNGYENINLTYTFKYSSYNRGRHSKSDFMPYVAYLDKNGNIQDYFFDSYLFLPCMGYGPSGARMHIDPANPTKAIDWTTYVEDTFYSGKNVDALDDAFGDVKSELGDEDKKAGVFFTILYPGKNATDFGTLGGKSLNFSKLDDRKYAIKWIIDEQIKLFEENNYQNLDLVGFYWLEEYLLDNTDITLFKYTSDYLHSKGLKLIWIPWYKADGYNKVSQLGVDAACMQPNLFWMGMTDPYRVGISADISKQYGMGMEMELDYTVQQDYYFNRYLYYLEGGMNSGMMDLVKMYYQDTGPGVYHTACYSSNENMRNAYDLTYKYAKGTLTQADIDAVRKEGFDDGYVEDVEFDKIFKSADWISIGKPYTGVPSYVDGNGSAYQNVSGKELTDGIIATRDLGTDWFAFHKSNTDSSGRMSITIDLGEIRNDIKHFAAHFDNKHLYAIGAPLDIKIYTSINGKDFRLFETAKLKLDQTTSCFYINDRTVTARYIKLSIGDLEQMYAFCSEFLVGVDHVHAPETEWTFDETGHWHQCRCDERFDETSHTLGAEADCENDQVCLECGYVANKRFGHEYDETIIEPTCTSEGYTICDCRNCDSKFNDDYMDPLGHSYEWVVTTEAQIGIDGLKEYKCSNCGDVDGTEIIPALPEDITSDTDSSDDNSSDDITSDGDTSDEDISGDIIIGDINQNGKIDMTDYILLKRAYFGTYKFNDYQNKAGDINANAKIDMTDYILLKRIYFGTYTLKK